MKKYVNFRRKCAIMEKNNSEKEENMNLRTAILSSSEGDAIGWNKNRGLYEIYNPEYGAPQGISFQFLIVEKGRMPWALTKDAVKALYNLLMEN